MKNTRNNATKIPISDNTHSKYSLNNEEEVANERYVGSVEARNNFRLKKFSLPISKMR